MHSRLEVGETPGGSREETSVGVCDSWGEESREGEMEIVSDTVKHLA